MNLKCLIILFLLSTFYSRALAEGVFSISLPKPDNTKVSAKVYSPVSQICKGIVVISHGAGGNQDGYSYLGRYLSINHFLTVIPTHLQSDQKSLSQLRKEVGLKAGLLSMTTNPRAYQERLVDIGAARVWALKNCSSDFSVLIGHSMGAATVMIEAAAKNLLGLSGENRFDAYIALSPQGEGPIFDKHSWDNLFKPLLSITGTRDDELSGNSWEHRTQPYYGMPVGCKWLAVVNGATHLHFAGIGFSSKSEKIITEVTSTFLQSIRSNCAVPDAMVSTRGLKLLAK